MGDIKHKERISITGKIKVDVFRAGYAELVAPILKKIAELRPLSSQSWLIAERIAALENDLFVIRHEHFIRTAVECPNTVMDSPNYGIDLLIQWLSGVGTYASTVLPLS